MRGAAAWPYHAAVKRTRLGMPFVVLAAAATAAAQADVIKPTKGAPIVARLWEAGADEVTFNVYRTSIRKVTHGTRKLPAKGIKQVLDDPDPHRAFWQKAGALRDGTAEAWFQLGGEAARIGIVRLARTGAVGRGRADRDNLDRLAGGKLARRAAQRKIEAGEIRRDHARWRT